MRPLNTAATALRARALAGEMIPLVMLVQFDLPVVQRWAICGLPLVWGGYTWAPLDIVVSEIKDDADQASGVRFTVPGVSESDLAMAMSADVGGAAVTVRMAWVDPADGTVADAVQIWAGELDLAGWQDGPHAVVHYTAEHRAGVSLRPRVSRYTDDEQGRLSAGDTSLYIDPQTDAPPIVWPAASYFKV